MADLKQGHVSLWKPSLRTQCQTAGKNISEGGEPFKTIISKFSKIARKSKERTKADTITEVVLFPSLHQVGSFGMCRVRSPPSSTCRTSALCNKAILYNILLHGKSTGGSPHSFVLMAGYVSFSPFPLRSLHNVNQIDFHCYDTMHKHLPLRSRQPSQQPTTLKFHELVHEPKLNEICLPNSSRTPPSIILLYHSLLYSSLTLLLSYSITLLFSYIILLFYYLTLLFFTLLFSYSTLLLLYYSLALLFSYSIILYSTLLLLYSSLTLLFSYSTILLLYYSLTLLFLTLRSYSYIGSFSSKLPLMIASNFKHTDVESSIDVVSRHTKLQSICD